MLPFEFTKQFYDTKTPERISRTIGEEEGIAAS
jgi:hypothetical protein